MLLWLLNCKLFVVCCFCLLYKYNNNISSLQRRKPQTRPQTNSKTMKFSLFTSNSKTHSNKLMICRSIISCNNRACKAKQSKPWLLHLLLLWSLLLSNACKLKAALTISGAKSVGLQRAIFASLWIDYYINDINIYTSAYASSAVLMIGAICGINKEDSMSFASSLFFSCQTWNLFHRVFVYYKRATCNLQQANIEQWKAKSKEQKSESKIAKYEFCDVRKRNNLLWLCFASFFYCALICNKTRRKEVAKILRRQNATSAFCSFLFWQLKPVSLENSTRQCNRRR